MVSPLEHELTAVDGVSLFVRDWLPDSPEGPSALVIIVHGMGEHGGRYQHVADVLTSQGCAVRASEWPGKGW